MSEVKNTSKIVNTVYSTDDLGIFNQMKGNRPPNVQHINRLCDSIKTNGVLQNPIIVNECMDVIDGQHRLLAAKKAKSSIFYIIVHGYSLNQVQILNLNQKNWVKKDFLNGYADMGLTPYIKLRDFMLKNNDFTISTCIAMCQNTTSAGGRDKHGMSMNRAGCGLEEVFEEGTWKGRDFELAQLYADNLKMIKPYYSGYNRLTFAATMLSLFKNPNFNILDFVGKLKKQPNKLYDCSSVVQYKELIELIYNHRRKNKVNLRF